MGEGLHEGQSWTRTQLLTFQRKSDQPQTMRRKERERAHLLDVSCGDCRAWARVRGRGMAWRGRGSWTSQEECAGGEEEAEDGQPPHPESFFFVGH